MEYNTNSQELDNIQNNNIPQETINTQEVSDQGQDNTTEKTIQNHYQDLSKASLEQAMSDNEVRIHKELLQIKKKMKNDSTEKHSKDIKRYFTEI